MIKLYRVETWKHGKRVGVDRLSNGRFKQLDYNPLVFTSIIVNKNDWDKFRLENLKRDKSCSETIREFMKEWLKDK